MENLNNPAYLVFIIPAVIIAINQFLKKIGMKEKFAPLVNIGLGFVAIYPLMQMGLNLLPAIIGSLIIGLSSGGFYDLKQVVK